MNSILENTSVCSRVENCSGLAKYFRKTPDTTRIWFLCGWVMKAMRATAERKWLASRLRLQQVAQKITFGVRVAHGARIHRDTMALASGHVAPARPVC